MSAKESKAIFGHRYVSHQPHISTLERGPQDVKQFLRWYCEPFPICRSPSKTG